MKRSYSAFARYYDALTQNVQYAARARLLDQLIQAHKKTAGNILLDLACGTGSMSQEFAKLGYDVIGVDNSPEMLNCAMNKKMDSELPIQYLCQDMRQLDMFGTIDVTVCLLDSLNHLDSLEDITQVFRRVSLFAEPNGLFLFDLNTLYKHRSILENHIYVYDTESVYCVWENQLQADQATVQMQLDFFERDGNAYYRSSERLCERAYPLDQITDALRVSGLRPVSILDEDGVHAPSDTSQRVMIIARKEATWVV